MFRVVSPQKNRLVRIQKAWHRHHSRKPRLAVSGHGTLPRREAQNCSKEDGNQFVVCDHNEFNNPSTCKVTLSLLKANRDFPHNCQLCLQDVGGSPSVGKATDEKDARGYTGEILPTTQQQ